MTVQRYSLPRSAFDVPAATHWRLGLHVGGPLKVEARFGDARHGQRWLNHGHFNLIPATTDAHWEFLGNPELVLVHLSTDLLDEAAAEIPSLDPSQVSLHGHLAVPDETVTRLAQLLLAETESDQPGTRLFADGLSRALTVHVLRHYSSTAATGRREEKPAFLTGRIGRVV